MARRYSDEYSYSYSDNGPSNYNDRGYDDRRRDDSYSDYDDYSDDSRGRRAPPRGGRPGLRRGDSNVSRRDSITSSEPSESEGGRDYYDNLNRPRLPDDFKKTWPVRTRYLMGVLWIFGVLIILAGGLGQETPWLWLEFIGGAFVILHCIAGCIVSSKDTADYIHPYYMISSLVNGLLIILTIVAIIVMMTTGGYSAAMSTTLLVGFIFVRVFCIALYGTILYFSWAYYQEAEIEIPDRVLKARETGLKPSESLIKAQPSTNYRGGDRDDRDDRDDRRGRGRDDDRRGGGRGGRGGDRYRSDNDRRV